jgi:predicted amidophosphoribosyltransferase
MEWITSLLKANCPFCGVATSNCSRACVTCAGALTLLEAEPRINTRLDELEVVAASEYRDFTQRLILKQKKHCSRPVVKWLAQMLLRKMPPEWKTIPVVWLPGRALGEEHLVEALALELHRLGQPLVARSALVRRLKPAKPQKALDIDDRKTRDIRELYRCSYFRPSGRVLLLDDVVTTGSTLTGCKQILEAGRPDFKVLGALAIAYTPKKTPERRHESYPQDLGHLA